MTMHISTVVLTTPHRELDPSIPRELSGTAGLVTDHGQPADHWRGYAAAWLAAATPEHADWCLVIEDDAELCPGFRIAAGRALRYAPTGAVHFYPVRQACRDAWEQGKSWAQPSDWLNSQAVAMRRQLAVDFVPWCEAPDRQALRDYCTRDGDCRLKAFLRARKVRMSFTVPGLVQHARVPSHFNRPGGRRSNLDWATLGVHPLSVDWSKT